MLNLSFLAMHICITFEETLQSDEERCMTRSFHMEKGDCRAWRHRGTWKLAPLATPLETCKNY